VSNHQSSGAKNLPTAIEGKPCLFFFRHVSPGQTKLARFKTCLKKQACFETGMGLFYRKTCLFFQACFLNRPVLKGTKV
jgi:hypothetical protein